MPASIFPCFVSLFAAYISNQDITDAELQEFVLGHECTFVCGFMRMSAFLCDFYA